MPSTNRSGNQGSPAQRQNRRQNQAKKSGAQVQRARRAKVQVNRNQTAQQLPAVRPNGSNQQPRRQNRPTARRAGAGRKPNTGSGKAKTNAAASAGSNKLSKLLTPETVQESIKSVGNLRKMVKNGLGYLQQADQVLETLYATSNSLKESGVLDKIIKQRGKNLSTEDFTNILMALMSSPIGGQLFKGSNNESANAGDA